MIDGKDTADYGHTAPSLSLHSAELARCCFMGKVRPFALLSVQKRGFGRRLAGLSVVTALPCLLLK